MTTLSDLPNIIPNFASLSHAQKIKIFAWFLHTQSRKEYFAASHIRECYQKLAIDPPANLNRSIDALTEKKPREILRNANGYKLERRVLDELQTKYGQRSSTVQVHYLLEQLPTRISNIAERNFLSEAIICLRYNAPRAAIIMCWNLAFDHLCEYIFNNHLAQFNAQWLIRFPGHHKSATKVIIKKDDFTELLKESEVIEICNSANIITSNIYKILKEKLDRRNIAAHPNSVAVTILQAEDCITDLVNNVVLFLV